MTTTPLTTMIKILALTMIIISKTGSKWKSVVSTFFVADV